MAFLLSICLVAVCITVVEIVAASHGINGDGLKAYFAGMGALSYAIVQHFVRKVRSYAASKK